jgi:hypothetical protein
LAVALTADAQAWDVFLGYPKSRMGRFLAGSSKRTKTHCQLLFRCLQRTAGCVEIRYRARNSLQSGPKDIWKFQYVSIFDRRTIPERTTPSLLLE